MTDWHSGHILTLNPDTVCSLSMRDLSRKTESPLCGNQDKWKFGVYDAASVTPGAPRARSSRGSNLRQKREACCPWRRRSWSGSQYASDIDRTRRCSWRCAGVNGSRDNSDEICFLLNMMTNSFVPLSIDAIQEQHTNREINHKTIAVSWRRVSPSRTQARRAFREKN